MGTIIGLGEWKAKKAARALEEVKYFPAGEAEAFGENKELTELLRDAHALRTAMLGDTATPSEFKKFLEGRIGTALIESKMIDRSHFLSGLYAADLLTRTLKEQPESWWAVDFKAKSVATGDVFALKNGGDMCFLIAAVFPELGNRRLMDISYYEKMGVGFYYEFYSQRGAEIGYHMSACFRTIAAVTQLCLASMHERG